MPSSACSANQISNAQHTANSSICHGNRKMTVIGEVESEEYDTLEGTVAIVVIRGVNIFEINILWIWTSNF